MAWIFNTSKNCVINSNHIQFAHYELQPEFEINVYIRTEKGNRADKYTIYKKTDVEEKKILERLDELSKQIRDLGCPPLTERSIEDLQKSQNQIRQINHESFECKCRLEDLRKNRKTDPKWKETFEKFLSYLSDPNFHASNNLYDFSEML
jgi:hypothetical protein